jgi:hypothetical protein
VNHSVVMRLRDFAVDGTYELSNNRVNFSQSKTNWNWTGRLVNTVPIETNFVVAASGATNSLYFDWQVTQSIPTNASNFVVNSVRVRPALALLYGDGGRRPPGVSIIRDWAAPEDFVSFTFNQSEIGLVSSNYPSVGFGDTKAPLERVLPTNVSYGAAPPGPLVMKSISKNDPRVRTYSWTPATRLAWTNAAPSLGSNNPSVNFSAETGIDGISNDPVIGIANMYDHPSFRGISGDRLLNSWSSAFDMSRVHTGLQWRTIQLRAQSLDEAKEKLVPDWALLEVFTVTNNPIAVPAKINVNSLAFPAGSNTAPAALAAAGLARPLAIASLLAGNTNGTNATNAQFNGANLGLPSNAVFPVSGPNSYTAVATNIARLNFSPGWAQNRPTNLPSNSIVMLAEVLEADGVSNVGNDEAANEGRVRGFYDALAASSDVFTIYSVGYATTTNGTVTGEIFLRTQVARDPSNPSRFRPVFTEPLIWK